MSYSAWASSLHIPHLQAASKAAADSSVLQPASAALSLSYACACRRLHPHLAFLYWCRQCACLQCAHCSTQQVDTYFCPACLNSVFTTPAFANQNRCEQCVECPSCSHILSSVHLRSGAYAYACEYCKWSSDEYQPHTHTHSHAGGGAAADSASSAPKPSPLMSSESNLLSARIKEAETSSTAGATATFAYLAAHYRGRYKANVAAASAAAAAAGMVGFSGTGNALMTAAAGGTRRKSQLFDEFEALLANSDAHNPLTGGDGAEEDDDGTGVGSSAAQSGLESSNVGRWMAWRAQREEVLHAQHYTLPTDPVHNNFDAIPPALLGYFGGEESSEAGAAKGPSQQLQASAQPRSLADISTLQQRLAHPSGQHFLASELLPRRKALATKIAQRCNQCNKHIVKPGPGASKPTFEIHMAALSFLPTITIGQFPPLEVGVTTDIILYFKNPVERGMKLWLSLPDDAAGAGLPAATVVPSSARSSSSSSSSQPQLPVLVRDASALVDFVRVSTVLAAYDDLPEENAAWVDPAAAASSAATDASERGLVVFRHLSKVGLLLHVTPKSAAQSTHFVIQVNFQMESTSSAASVEPVVTAATAAGSPAPVPSPVAAPITTFPLHVNLGFASAKQEAQV